MEAASGKDAGSKEEEEGKLGGDAQDAAVVEALLFPV